MIAQQQILSEAQHQWQRDQEHPRPQQEQICTGSSSNSHSRAGNTEDFVDSPQSGLSGSFVNQKRVDHAESLRRRELLSFAHHILGGCTKNPPKSDE
jgi:hypothetical protein